MTRETNLRGQAQRARTYSYAQHGRQNRGGLQGDHILRKGAGVEIWKPSWKGTTTTIRIYPALSPENPEQWDPWRFSADDDEWGDWIRTYPAVRNFGEPGVTYILFDPADEGYDPQRNPAWMLYHAIDRAVAAGQGQPKWAPLLRGGNGRGAVLSRPGSISLVQCAILAHNNKDYDPPRGGAVNDGTIVMELSPSAASAMLELMNERNPEFRGDANDFENMFVNGDPVSIEHGRFVNFFQLGHDPRERMQVNPQARRASSFGQARAGSGRGGNDEGPIGYGCFMTPSHNGMPADLRPVEEMVRRKWRSWDSIIQILNHEQQIKLLAGAFEADVLVYALENAYGDLLPDSVWRQYDNRNERVVSGPSGDPPPHQAPRSVRGWGGQSTQSSQTREQPAAALTRGQEATPPVRGWGAQSSERTTSPESEAIPEGELQDPEGGFDDPPQAHAQPAPAPAPAPAAPAAPASAPAPAPAPAGLTPEQARAQTQEAIRRSRERVRQRTPPPAGR